MVVADDVLLLTVSVQCVLTVFSIETPPPSAVAVLLVTTMLFSVRLALPWSRMPPPLPAAPSPGRAMPPVMVKPCMVTVNSALELASVVGLMSKTRSRPLPLTVTWPPLVLTMVRLPPAGRVGLGDVEVAGEVVVLACPGRVIL